MHSDTHLSFPCDPQASDTLDNVKAEIQDKNNMAGRSGMHSRSWSAVNCGPFECKLLHG